MTTTLADHVREIFSKELAEIHDEGLREKTVLAWARVMELSGVRDLWLELPFTSGADVTGDGVEHMRCVARVALAIADALIASYGSPIDRDVVVAGALLHDVGKLMEHAPRENHVLTGPLVQHAFSGMYVAAEAGLPREVLHVIAYHSVEGHHIHRTLEAEIIYRADIIAFDAFARQRLGKTASEVMPYVYLPRHV